MESLVPVVAKQEKTDRVQGKVRNEEFMLLDLRQQLSGLPGSFLF
jgi:hypothetical protein